MGPDDSGRGVGSPLMRGANNPDGDALLHDVGAVPEPVATAALVDDLQQGHDEGAESLEAIMMLGRRPQEMADLLLAGLISGDLEHQGPVGGGGKDMRQEEKARRQALRAEQKRQQQQRKRALLGFDPLGEGAEDISEGGGSSVTSPSGSSNNGEGWAGDQTGGDEKGAEGMIHAYSNPALLQMLVASTHIAGSDDNSDYQRLFPAIEPHAVIRRLSRTGWTVPSTEQVGEPVDGGRIIASAGAAAALGLGLGPELGLRPTLSPPSPVSPVSLVSGFGSPGNNPLSPPMPSYLLYTPPLQLTATESMTAKPQEGVMYPLSAAPSTSSDELRQVGHGAVGMDGTTAVDSTKSIRCGTISTAPGSPSHDHDAPPPDRTDSVASENRYGRAIVLTDLSRLDDEQFLAARNERSRNIAEQLAALQEESRHLQQQSAILQQRTREVSHGVVGLSTLPRFSSPQPSRLENSTLGAGYPPTLAAANSTGAPVPSPALASEALPSLHSKHRLLSAGSVLGSPTLTDTPVRSQPAQELVSARPAAENTTTPAAASTAVQYPGPAPAPVSYGLGSAVLVPTGISWTLPSRPNNPSLTSQSRQRGLGSPPQISSNLQLQGNSFSHADPQPCKADQIPSPASTCLDCRSEDQKRLSCSPPLLASNIPLPLPPSLGLSGSTLAPPPAAVPSRPLLQHVPKGPPRGGLGVNNVVAGGSPLNARNTVDVGFGGGLPGQRQQQNPQRHLSPTQKRPSEQQRKQGLGAGQPTHAMPSYDLGRQKFSLLSQLGQPQQQQPCFSPAQQPYIPQQPLPMPNGLAAQLAARQLQLNPQPSLLGASHQAPSQGPELHVPMPQPSFKPFGASTLQQLGMLLPQPPLPLHPQPPSVWLGALLPAAAAGGFPGSMVSPQHLTPGSGTHPLQLAALPPIAVPPGLTNTKGHAKAVSARELHPSGKSGNARKLPRPKPASAAPASCGTSDTAAAMASPLVATQVAPWLSHAGLSSLMGLQGMLTMMTPPSGGDIQPTGPWMRPMLPPQAPAMVAGKQASVTAPVVSKKQHTDHGLTGETHLCEPKSLARNGVQPGVSCNLQVPFDFTAQFNSSIIPSLPVPNCAQIPSVISTQISRQAFLPVNESKGKGNTIMQVNNASSGAMFRHNVSKTSCQSDTSRTGPIARGESLSSASGEAGPIGSSSTAQRADLVQQQQLERYQVLEASVLGRMEAQRGKKTVVARRESSQDGRPVFRTF